MPSATLNPARVPFTRLPALRMSAMSLALLAATPAFADGLAADADQAQTLDTLNVRADRDANTEGSSNYGAKATTLFKGVQSIRQTPQPVTVISRQLLDDRALLDLHDVLQNTPGVTVDYVDSERVTYFSRGFSIDALQIDGLSIDQSGSVFIQPDTAVLDRVEILRGAAGLLKGAGNPSATVNMARKRPTDTFQASGVLSLGSWDRRRAEADVSGPLNSAGTVRGRLVAAYDEKDFFQKAREEEKRTVYGVIEADLTESTLLTASLQQTDLDATGSWGGMPSDFDGRALDLPRSTYLGASWNQWNRYNQQAFLSLEHRFDNGWRTALSYAFTRFGYNGPFIQTSFSRSNTTNPYLVDVDTAIYGPAGSHQNAVNFVAEGPIELFGRTHQLTVGAEGRNVKTANSSGHWGINRIRNVDARTWDPYTSYAPPQEGDAGTYYGGINNETQQKGVFAVARISITDPLTALVGARLNWWEYSVPTNPSSNYSVDREFMPYAGLVYDLSSTLSLYASYSEIFVPQNAYQADGQLLKPITGQDYEAGIKGEFFAGRLNAALSAFRINNVGRAMDDASSANPCLPYYTTGYCKVDGGKTRSQGWEAEVSGQLTEGWQMMAGYTNTRTEYLRDPSAANLGQPLRSADPRHLLRLSTSYRFPGVLNKLRAGASVQAQSETYVTSRGVTSRQGGYAVYGVMAGYDLSEAISLQLNVNNLFDKSYFRKYGPNTFNTYYADPRNVMFSVRARF